MPAAFFINLSYKRLHLRCAACQLFRGDRLYLAGLVQLLAGHGQHQFDAVFLVDAGRAGVVVHGGDVRVRVQGADLIDHALAHNVVRQTAERLQDHKGTAAVGGMVQVTARMDVKDLKMELTGKSTATLTGAVRYLSLFVSTGKLEAAGLEVMAAEANVTSSGVAALWVTDRFQGKTSTGGKITYKGAPPIVRSGAKFMGGDITRVE